MLAKNYSALLFLKKDSISISLFVTKSATKAGCTMTTWGISSLVMVTMHISSLADRSHLSPWCNCFDFSNA